MYNSESQASSSDHEQQHKNYEDLKIMDPHEYLSYCVKDKKIKVMDECNPIMSNVYLKDISLHKKGPLEDKIYSKNDKYYLNIRRGNTLCQIYNEKSQETDLLMCRRGMKKFYDLEPEYLKVNRQLTHQHKRFRNRIFELLDESIGTHKIHLYCLFKENGEHCQIGYIKKLDSWLFASKNVAILVRTEDDLQNYYHKERFYWAKLIGKQFFNILKGFSEEEKQQFKKDIDGKTLLGEHCGYEKHQHITKYKEIQIIFYGLVENQAFDFCMPVEKCQSFLSKYRLKMSKMNKVQNLTKKNQIYEQMYKMLKEVSEGTMDKNGQGSVMYIVSEDHKSKNQQTIGMCKLKTAEYLIYRRMRQMIKIYFAKKGSTANNFQKYKFDIRQLAQTYFKPPQPLEFYERIAQEAFKEVKKHGEQFSDDEFRYRFVNFLENISTKKLNTNAVSTQIKKVMVLCLPLLGSEYNKVEKMCKRRKVKLTYSYQEQYSKSKLCLQHLVPRILSTNNNEYQEIIVYVSGLEKKEEVIKELTETKDISKSHLISFIKSEDKKKSIELLEQKLNSFVNVCKEKSIKCTFVQEFEDLVDKIQEIYDEGQENIGQNTEQKQQKPKTKASKTIILPLLIPGSGKTTFSSLLEKKININILSSDKIRQNVMNKKEEENNKQYQMEELYNETKKQGLQAYYKELQKSLKMNDDDPLFVDRVFCPTTIIENIKDILHHRPQTKIIILTQSINQIKLNDYIYPHSLRHLLTCLKRTLQRNQHQTLSSDPYTITKVLLKFYQMYRGYNYSKLAKSLQQIKADFEIVQLELTQENKQEVNNQYLKKKVQECLKSIVPGHQPLDSEHYTQLIELIYKYNSYFEKENVQEKEKEVHKLLKKINSM